MHVHASVAAATTTNITLSPAPATIDGVTLVEGMRILVKSQTAPAENGIYVLNGSGNLVRATDYDTAGEIQGGDFVFVTGGTTYAATGWVQVNAVSTLGTDPLEWDQFSGAGEYLGGTGIDISGNTVSIDFTEFDTNDITEGTTNLYFTAQRVVDAVVSDVDTDDVTEGTTNLYYTDARVKSLLTGSTQTNISITEVEGALVITAENGVADSTTDDLDEGTLNLYFTAQRAVTALEAVTPDFPAVEINSVTKQIAGTVLVESLDTPEAVLAWPKADYRSAKIVVKSAYGSHTEVSEVLLTLDSSDNIAITEYAEVGTNGSLSDITADISGTDVRVMVDVNNNNTTVTAFATLIA